MRALLPILATFLLAQSVVAQESDSSITQSQRELLTGRIEARLETVNADYSRLGANHTTWMGFAFGLLIATVSGLFALWEKEWMYKRAALLGGLALWLLIHVCDTFTYDLYLRMEIYRNTLREYLVDWQSWKHQDIDNINVKLKDGNELNDQFKGLSGKVRKTIMFIYPFDVGLCLWWWVIPSAMVGYGFLERKKYRRSRFKIVLPA